MNRDYKEQSDSRYVALDTMVIYNNPSIYAFLTSYYADDLSDPYFTREIEQAENPKLFICEQMAAWLPWEKHYADIMEYIQKEGWLKCQSFFMCFRRQPKLV